MMQKIKTIILKRLHLILSVFLIISVLVFISIGFTIHHQDLSQTYMLAEETTTFLRMECQKYDHYQRGLTANELQGLLDKARVVTRFFSQEQMSDSTELQKFIRTEHMSGIIIYDQNLSPVAEADLDDQNADELWHETVCKKTICDIAGHPQKTYVGQISRNGKSYAVAAVAEADQGGLIFCYDKLDKPTSDPYEWTLKTTLLNNNFYKNPALAITDGTKLLSTNSQLLGNLEEAEYQRLAQKIVWKSDQLTEFTYQNERYYGLRKTYGNYHLYAVYASKDIFQQRTDYVYIVLLLYLGVGILILGIQWHSDKLNMSRMAKQLRTINAISSAYQSTLLLHLDTLELEPIHVSERLAPLVQAHVNPCELLFAVCRKEIDPDAYPTVMHFLDIDTMAERLQGKTFLGCEVQDCYGAWFSVILIPQKKDEQGRALAVLVATRDISEVKKTEEMTFKDQLTGLYNRNYMEARREHFVRTGDFPVSLLMIDCNYLKRTNDTLGHEYGDLLLQRIANIILESIDTSCVAMRVGGDEFLVLCTHCDREKVQKMIDDMKKKMVERSDEKLHLSAAFGASTVEGEPFDFDRTYKAADAAMYVDKKASRAER